MVSRVASSQQLPWLDHIDGDERDVILLTSRLKANHWRGLAAGLGERNARIAVNIVGEGDCGE